jgi:hypothetical protein
MTVEKNKKIENKTDLSISLTDINDKEIIEQIEHYSEVINKSITNKEANELDYAIAVQKIEKAIDYLKNDVKNKLSICMTERDLILKLDSHKLMLDKHIENETNIPINEYNDLYKTFENFGNLADIDNELDNNIASMRKSKLIKAYILYCENPELLNFIFKPLYDIKPILDIDNFKESYLLDRPAMTINGKSIYLIIKNVPITLELDFKSCNPLLLELQLKGMDAHTIHAKKTSQHHENIYRNNRKFGLKEYIYVILLIIISCLTEYIILNTYYQSLLKGA